MAKIINKNTGSEKPRVTDTDKLPKHLPLPEFDPKEIHRLMELRRSIYPRSFSGESISREEIEQLLEDANWAPTHHRTEPWRFVVITGEGLVSFGKKHAELYKSATPEEKFQQRKYDKLKDKPTLCSHIIAICMLRDPNEKIPEIEEVMATACAVQNIHLSATAMGIAGYWSSGGMIAHEDMSEILGLSERERCLGLFHLGKPKNWWPEGRRTSSAADKTRWMEG